LGNKFNGAYLSDLSGSEKLSGAHLDALELLKIIHDICKKEHLSYSLWDDCLICHFYGKPFANISPYIVIALKYGHFQKLRGLLLRFVQEHPDYILADPDHEQQFDSMGLWLAKRNGVKLPEGREQDELYYYAHVEVRPVFFAGDHRLDCWRATHTYIRAIRARNARAPLPHRTLRTKIRICKRIVRDAVYRPHRDAVDLLAVMRKLGTAGPARFCFIPTANGTFKLTLPEIEKTTVTEFAGQQCQISSFAGEIVKRYPKEARDRVLKYRSNDLVRKGGETLRRVQLVQTELLAEFDRVCRKNNIRYTIAFGTLLGAVRHKGFIPWDDDIDVIVPIDDYLKLDEAMGRDLDTSRFFWRTIDTETDYNLTYKHLKRNGTVYMKPGRTKFKFHKGVLIDVFPVFHAANNRLTHWLQTRLCFFYRTATWAYMGADSERNVFKRFLYRQMRRPGPRRNYESFMRCATAAAGKNQFYSYFNASFRSPYHTYYLSDEAFNDPVELEFEGHKFFSPRKYQDTLAYCYGSDFMLYPVMEQRFPSHFAVIDLGGLYQDALSKGPGKNNTIKCQED